MAFCGSIQKIEMQEGSKAIVVFEKPSAASTALMLNGGTLDGSPIQVSSELVDEDTPSIAEDHDHHDIPQEAKPRTAIVAEYIAHGYVLSDSIIQKAVSFDQKHGISSKFLLYFNKLAEQAKARTAELEAQTHIQQNVAGVYAQADDKVKINEKAGKAYGIGKSYYNRILDTEFGQQALKFYTETSNNIKSVHDEASRIAADKKQASTSASSTLAPGVPATGTTAPATTATISPVVPAII